MPVREGDRLYGRGGADDGYSAFAALTAIEAVQAAGGAHARCVVVIEASEESGSADLPAHIENLGDRIGTPSLVVCLDSGCETYDRLWVTTSLRGLVSVSVSVDVLTEGMHSGKAGGIVPSSFRILRHLLDRIEDDRDGELLLPELFVEIPPDRIAQLQATADELGPGLADDYPMLPSAAPLGATPAELLLNRTWRPALATVGIDGLPPVGDAGNVLRPFTRAMLSLRLPPTCDPDRAAAAVRDALAEDPPPGAVVTVEVHNAAPGWNAPVTAPWLEHGMDAASRATFGEPARCGRRGRHDPVHGDAGRPVPGGPVPHHRRARPELERPRPERVPPHPDRRTRHRVQSPTSSTPTPTPNSRRYVDENVDYASRVRAGGDGGGSVVDAQGLAGGCGRGRRGRDR